MSTKLPNIKTHFGEWYNEVVYAAELADQSPVRGCIVIRPYGYALWENIKDILDKKIKDTGHQNALFPLLIPESFLKREAQHVEGFAPEVAVVTFAGGKELEEPLVVRPTSETIIHYMFARWLKSWRDLPIKINQWANVVRWEMRTRPFLRTTEFQWQEGHTAHETYEEAKAEVELMLEQYRDLIETYLAIPIVPARKPDSERFAGADITLTVEGLMQDGRALQMGTSHMISQSFAKSFDMTFQNREGVTAYPYLTSWGATTRLIGAVVMVHGDEKGLILPPKIAPVQVVIIPILRADSKDRVLNAAHQLALDLKATTRVIVDDEEHTTPGAKFYKWELKGVPLRIEIGPRDLEKNQVVIVDRLLGTKDIVDLFDIQTKIAERLKRFHEQLFERALLYRETLWFKKAKLVDFEKDLESKGGFYQTGWCGSIECENLIKEAKATIRCVLDENLFPTCFNCDKESANDILVAKAY
ncbi:proline--tRNA ligase [Candidatus Dependentiae bacterium]|nr:proline--tRNA ligase [Candidatus Dependentiae bacterium]